MSEKFVKTLIDYINEQYNPYDIIVLDPEEHGSDTCFMKVIFEDLQVGIPEERNIWTVYSFSGSTQYDITDEEYKTNVILKDVCKFFNISGARMVLDYSGSIPLGKHYSGNKLVLGAFLKDD